MGSSLYYAVREFSSFAGVSWLDGRGRVHRLRARTGPIAVRSASFGDANRRPEFGDPSDSGTQVPWHTVTSA